MVGIVIVLILIILEVLYELVNVESFNKLCGVLILIILEVLYELGAWLPSQFTVIIVLILIILEVLYEFVEFKSTGCKPSLNPYYTASTL